MNKAELIAALAVKAHVTKKEAETMLKALAAVTKEELKNADGKIQIPEIGSFKVVARKARKTRNPQTGESMMSKACNVPKFVAAKALKEAVNEK